MKCTFQVGDKVTPRYRTRYVSRRRGIESYGSDMGCHEPTFGEIYTVREVYIHFEPSIRLVGIINPNDLGYTAVSFRRAYDLSVFDKALKAQPVKPKEKENVI